jgi:Na+-driven multidrug efflux pump
LLIGALCGLSQAASVIVGKKLGNGEYDDAYSASKKLLLYGAIGSIILSGIVVLTSALYVEIYQVEDSVKDLTRQILFSYALIAPFKVLNMILGGGILRSGGETKYVMYIDMIGTWCFGVPLGLLSAFFLNLSIPYVYFILSLEECVRFIISLNVFRKKNWMKQLD